MKNPFRSPAEHDAARRAQVIQNENQVIAGALAIPLSDQSEYAKYQREVANDIIARRAANN